MPRLHWEDFSPGQVTECGSRLITRYINAFRVAADDGSVEVEIDDEIAGEVAVLKALVRALRNRPRPPGTSSPARPASTKPR